MTEEEVTTDAATFTKAAVKKMDDGEFEHALAYARQQCTPEGDAAAEELLKFRGGKAATEDSTES